MQKHRKLSSKSQKFRFSINLVSLQHFVNNLVIAYKPRKKTKLAIFLHSSISAFSHLVHVLSGFSKVPVCSNFMLCTPCSLPREVTCFFYDQCIIHIASMPSVFYDASKDCRVFGLMKHYSSLLVLRKYETKIH
jgi:hypothetical protein